MNLWVFSAAAVLLILERICYLWIWRKPGAFRYWCTRPALAWIGEPVDVIVLLFFSFKALQGAVFIGWCYVHGDGSIWPASASVGSVAAGAALIVAGQLLNAGVFYRLGKIGVFYGTKFGHKVPWSHEFPFSFFKHPQYLGVVLSIWGLFLLMRFPHEDWYFLPALESVYYLVGAHFER